jgi:antitoxin component YwqK of YwqJK toxin-antitoxin module
MSLLMKADYRLLLPLLGSGLLSVLSVSAQDGFDDVMNSDRTVVDATTTLPNDKVRKSDVRRLRPFLDSLPEGHQLKLEFATFGAAGGDPSKLPRYIHRLTPVDATGRPHGIEVQWSNWYQHPKRKTPWVEGKQHGIERLYEVDGTVTAEVPWVHGKIEGVRKTLYNGGAVATETTYVDGVAHGASRSYARDGQLIRTATFKRGKRNGDVIDYWPGRGDTVKRVVRYKNGAVDGVSKAYYASGKLKWERPFKDNEMHGVEKHYTPEGDVERSVTWQNGERAE